MLVVATTADGRRRLFRARRTPSSRISSIYDMHHQPLNRQMRYFPMAWIRTTPLEGKMRRCRRRWPTSARSIRSEYAQPVQELDQGVPGIVASHTLIPQALYHAFATFGALMSPDLPLRPPAARDDRHDGLAHEQVPLLNCLARRVSASGHPGRRPRPGASRGLHQGSDHRCGARHDRLRGQAHQGRHQGLARRTTSGCARPASTTAASSRSP